ncbi:MAG: hypothetical protein ACOYM4_03580 [Nodosilinea sp.]|jgi:hypothetical protein
MDEPQKLALIVQSNRLQGLMWQALLKSQKLAVILEPANGDLADCISQIATAGLTLPEIIVLDAEAAELRDVPLNKVPGVLIAVGCIREAMHHWESRQLVPYFLACP